MSFEKSDGEQPNNSMKSDANQKSGITSGNTLSEPIMDANLRLSFNKQDIPNITPRDVLPNASTTGNIYPNSNPHNISTFNQQTTGAALYSHPLTLNSAMMSATSTEPTTTNSSSSSSSAVTLPPITDASSSAPRAPPSGLTTIPLSLPVSLASPLTLPSLPVSAPPAASTTVPAVPASATSTTTSSSSSSSAASGPVPVAPAVQLSDPENQILKQEIDGKTVFFIGSGENMVRIERKTRGRPKKQVDSGSDPAVKRRKGRPTKAESLAMREEKLRLGKDPDEKKRKKAKTGDEGESGKTDASSGNQVTLPDSESGEGEDKNRTRGKKIVFPESITTIPGSSIDPTTIASVNAMLANVSSQSGLLNLPVTIPTTLSALSTVASLQAQAALGNVSRNLGFTNLSLPSLAPVPNSAAQTTNITNGAATTTTSPASISAASAATAPSATASESTASASAGGKDTETSGTTPNETDATGTSTTTATTTTLAPPSTSTSTTTAGGTSSASNTLLTTSSTLQQQPATQQPSLPAPLTPAMSSQPSLASQQQTMSTQQQALASALPLPLSAIGGLPVNVSADAMGNYNLMLPAGMSSQALHTHHSHAHALALNQYAHAQNLAHAQSMAMGGTGISGAGYNVANPVMSQFQMRMRGVSDPNAQGQTHLSHPYLIPNHMIQNQISGAHVGSLGSGLNANLGGMSMAMPLSGYSMMMPPVQQHPNDLNGANLGSRESESGNSSMMSHQ